MNRAQAVTLFALAMFWPASPALAMPPQDEVAQIEGLSGCFDVTYIFIEDGRQDTFAKGRPVRTKEWVGLWRSEGGRLTLPHVSITPDNRAVPHWYEIWRYRPEKKAWTQEVWRKFPGDPGSRLRYSCTAPWTMNRWQCHAGPTPKPFRDKDAPFGFNRKDYQRLDRENILLVTEKGWIHNEHNKKINAEGTIVSYELGWITYRRMPEDRCRVAIEEYGKAGETPGVR